MHVCTQCMMLIESYGQLDGTVLHRNKNYTSQCNVIQAHLSKDTEHTKVQLLFLSSAESWS